MGDALSESGTGVGDGGSAKYRIASNSAVRRYHRRAAEGDDAAARADISSIKSPIIVSARGPDGSARVSSQRAKRGGDIGMSASGPKRVFLTRAIRPAS